MTKRAKVSIKEATRIHRGARLEPQCSMKTNTNKQCRNDATWRVTRPDGSYYLVCGADMAKLQRAWDKWPGPAPWRQVERIR